MIAYSRGIYFEQLADRQLQSEHELTTAANINYKNAIDQFNSAIHFQPKYAECYHHRGLCRRRLENYAAATTDLSEAIALQPGDWQCWRDRGMNYTSAEQFEPAVKDFSEAIRLHPAAAESLLAARAHCEQLLGQYDQALDDASKAIRVKSNAQNYCCRAGIYRVLQKYKLMFADYDAALTIEPRNIDAIVEKAYGNLSSGNDEAAYAGFERALRLSIWKNRAGYCVISATLACWERGIDASELLDEAVEVLKIPVSSKDGAQDAKPSEKWPLPVIQYMRHDISKAALLDTAKNNRNRMTEVNTYLAYEELSKHHVENAKKLFQWVADNGNHDFYEYELAVASLSRLLNQPRPRSNGVPGKAIVGPS